MDKLPAPPVFPDTLTADYVASIRDSMSESQLELWGRLVRPSLNKNHPKQAVLLVSIPRQAGGVSVAGFEFRTRNGDIDLKEAVTPLTMRRLSPAYMRERGGASAAMYSKHVVVIGCGAIGAVVADALAATGVGGLTLVDSDDFSEDNVFRYILDPFWIDSSKVFGLKYQLETHYPGIKVIARATSGQEWLRGANLGEVDAVVFALGLPTLEQSFARALRKATGGQALIDTVSGFAQLASQFPADVLFVVWLNPYWGAIEQDGKGFEQMKAYTSNKARVSSIVNIPSLKKETYGRDLSDMLQSRLTFDEALAMDSLTIMTRQRLKIIKGQVFGQLENAAVL